MENKYVKVKYSSEPIGKEKIVLYFIKIALTQKEIIV